MSDDPWYDDPDLGKPLMNGDVGDRFFDPAEARSVPFVHVLLRGDPHATKRAK